MMKQKQISFDVDTNVAKEILGEYKYIRVYSDIRFFMERKGWKHIEGSVYMSKKSIGDMDVFYTINELLKENPYIEKCMRTMHQADVMNIHSLEHYFSYDGTPGKYKDMEQKKEPVKKAGRAR